MFISRAQGERKSRFGIWAVLFDRDALCEIARLIGVFAHEDRV